MSNPYREDDAPMPTIKYAPKSYVSDKTKAALFNIFLLVLAGISLGLAVECYHAMRYVAEGGLIALAIGFFVWSAERAMT